ncbi:MAG: carbohydrate porin [Deltaproteobacteria bacterium]|nr:carbohydrate porin [Deltaproteobacteria bacterium]MBW1720120.1 carbohydrate porin [Deltaproteobacteria bacterium]MBW1965103.1 carbohydrate porin [Deltaproteobacteria bacterium]MBW2351303.1 carbohydrate porin [Deltaproteobacteria bacterium]
MGKWLEDKIVLKLLEPYTDAKKWLHDKTKLEIAMQQLLFCQSATGGRNPNDTAISNFTFFGQWHLVDHSFLGKGSLGYYVERRDNLADATVTDFSDEVGAAWGSNDFGISTRDRTALRQLWWEQRMFEEKLALTVGKLHTENYYDRNSFAGSGSTKFVSQPFAINPARLFPSDALGLNVAVYPGNNYYLTFGFHDANGKTTTSGFNSIDKSELFKAFLLALTPVFDGLGRGNYRFTFWHTDETDDHDDGLGFLISFDQELGKSLGVFLKYGYSEPKLNKIEHLISTGFVIRNPWKMQGDLMGAGFSWDSPGNGARDEYAIEMFYRVQLTTHVQLTPSVVFIFNPYKKENSGALAVFGLRCRALF